MNVFVFSDDFAGFRSLFCEAADVTAEDGEKFVRLTDAEKLQAENKRLKLVEEVWKLQKDMPAAMIEALEEIERLKSLPVVLPEREEGEPYWSGELDADFDQRLEWAEAKGFNRAIDKVKELNK